MFEKLADFIMKNAKIIVTLWIVALLIAVPFMLKYNSVLQYDMSNMKTSTPMESVKGQEMLSSEDFNPGGGLNGGTIIIVEAYDSLAAKIAPTINKNLTENFYSWEHNAEIRTHYGVDYQVTVQQLGRLDDKYYKDIDTQIIVFTVGYPELPDGKESKNSDYVPEVRKIVSESVSDVDGVVDTFVTGTDAISYDTSTGFTQDIKHIDPISILLVLILIGLFFRSFVAAGTPPVIIGMAYGILLAVVYAIGSFMGIYYITTILVLVSMLGAGCDYCIFIVSRYREERKEGKPHKEALRESIIWAGESIITSGISVIIGFGSLMLCSFSLVSTMGMVLAIGIVLALLAALTFIPSLLMLIGDKIFLPSKVSTYKEGSKAMKGWYGKCAALGHKYFTHSAQTSIKYAKIIFVATILISVPLVYVAATSSASYDMISAMPESEAKDGVGVVSDDVGGGLLMPTNISMKVDAFVDLNVNTELPSGGTVQKYVLGTHENTVTFKASPEDGYFVQGWVINGSYYDDTSSYPYPAVPVNKNTIVVNPDDSMNVVAVFAKTEFTVTFNPNDANGSISAKDNGITLVSGLRVNYGDKVVFTAAPNKGYHVDHWVITKGAVSETVYSHSNVYTVDRLTSDCNVEVFFAQDTSAKYTVTITVNGGHGSAAVRADGAKIESGDEVNSRSHIVMSAIADKDYKFSKWTVKAGGVTTVYDDPGDVVTEIEYIEADTMIFLEFAQIQKENYEIDYSWEGDGSVTAIVNDTDTVASGGTVTEGSKVVFKATPGSGKMVIGWEYTIYYNGTPITFTSYVSKTEHVIASINSAENIKVIFGESAPETVNVSTPDDPGRHGSIYIMEKGANVAGGSFPKGTDLLFTAKVDEGYHIKNWVVTSGGIPAIIKSTSKNLSLYDITDDTTVTYVTIEDNFVSVFYGANDSSMGSVTACDDESVINYSERANANEIFTKFNEFTQSLIGMETDGKRNVAVAVGPVNGDILFDGQHEWIFDTVWEVLPQDIKNVLPSGLTYDALVYAWHFDPTVVTPDIKDRFNYYLTYKAGFVSEVFTDYEGGPEYQYVKIIVVSKDEPMSALSVDTIKQLYERRDAFVEENSVENGGFVHEAYLSGAAVSNYEMSVMVNNDFNYIIFVVVGLLIILLFLVMNSYLTPVRAVMTIVMSVLWTLGLTYIIFEHLLGMPVVWIVPIVLFVVCLGLGMDYDILLTTRIKEFVSKGHTNDEAITMAVQKSGAVITLCGLIMAGAFGTMMLSTAPMLKEFGFALGFAIAVDALIIRTYIVPAIMHLMGDWNWKGPNLGMIKNRVLERINNINDDEEE